MWEAFVGRSLSMSSGEAKYRIDDVVEWGVMAQLASRNRNRKLIAYIDQQMKSIPPADTFCWIKSARCAFCLMHQRYCLSLLIQREIINVRARGASRRQLLQVANTSKIFKRIVGQCVTFDTFGSAIKWCIESNEIMHELYGFNRLLGCIFLTIFQ